MIVSLQRRKARSYRHHGNNKYRRVAICNVFQFSCIGNPDQDSSESQRQIPKFFSNFSIFFNSVRSVY
jgi:hypothetical protein